MTAQEDMTRRRIENKEDEDRTESQKKEAALRQELRGRAYATVTRALCKLSEEDQKRVVEAMAALLGMKVARE